MDSNAGVKQVDESSKAEGAEIMDYSEHWLAQLWSYNICVPMIQHYAVAHPRTHLGIDVKAELLVNWRCSTVCK